MEMGVCKLEKPLSHLVESIRAGDEEAFDILFRSYYSNLCRFGWRYVKSKAVAEELVQDVFAYIWENRGNWEPLGTVRGYLYKSVKHRAIDYLKHQLVVDQYHDLMKSEINYVTIEINEEQHDAHLRDAIAKAIENLPERAKMVFKLHRYDGLSYKEIAQVMDISVKTVENQMTRVFKLLRQDLSHLFPVILVLLGKILLH